jgi:hypothetical protein
MFSCQAKLIVVSESMLMTYGEDQLTVTENPKVFIINLEPIRTSLDGHSVTPLPPPVSTPVSKVSYT